MSEPQRGPSRAADQAEPSTPDGRSGRTAPAWELRAFRLSVALIGLHVVDDRFLQPEPGVSAADHLVSGVVPLIVLTAAALVYARLRAGWRAVCALALGVLGLAASSEAVYYTREVGPSGDDYTGLLTIPAALALLAIATVVVWRSRRRDGSMVWLVTRRALLSVAALLVTFLVLLPIAQVYTLTHVMTPTVPAPGFNHAYEEVSFTTADGLRLEGWYVPSDNGAAVVVFPGRTDRDEYVDLLAENGYGVLLFDRRGEGDSEGDPNLLGWGGAEDLEAAAAFLQSRPDVEPGRIGGIGLSVGGELLIEAAAGSGLFGAVVSEGAGTRSVREVLDRPGAPAVLDLWVWAVTTGVTSVLADRRPPPSIQHLLPEVAPAAVLLVYGEEGQPQEIAMNPEFYELAKDPKQLWEVPGAGHIDGLDTRPEEYERRVVGFFDAALLD